MKIIALHGAYHNETPSAIVELSGYELDKLLSEHDLVRAPKLRVGETVEICKRWEHLRNIEAKVKEAAALPAKLRTLADMLDMNVPAIEELIAKPNVEEVSA